MSKSIDALPNALAPEDFFPALEIRRTRALVERDMPVIESLHAPEYELISPAGRLLRRDEYLALIAEAPFYSGWEHSDMQVRASEDLAVLRYRARLSFPSGKVVDCWHMDVYERRAAGWMAVWSKATAVPTTAPMK
ncbi:nuclear transport factor 2 family protein [Mitsuaria sp. 7]|uniref:nuclear transport factor 2 family protein n=1 Tax=Mitsuaria sp. 7 TaxID=1658665 RepID=UPI0018D3C952|nr:nuclear transport factor 2 family protein [Mitsuaria sp. 7]